ncbi:MAG: hypothetical protein K0U84_15100 [Actinomycetia bacterium]|nr:hypothetical protein [Actinomycetes bacterium]
MLTRIVNTLPKRAGWGAGFTAYLTTQLINGLAHGYLPFLRLNPLPPLYRSGVRYQLEPNHGAGWEEYADPWTVYARKWGDCDDLNLWRVMELLAKGEKKAQARAEWSGNQVHVLVRRGNGKLEDPSKILGG